MPVCNIKYIPKHLHQEERSEIPIFFDLEKLFWRLGKQNMAAPYSGISLYDVSCNRSGTDDNIISEEEDVLWNTDPDKLFEKYPSEVITLRVRKIFPAAPESITVPDDPPNPDRSAIMMLVHNPLPCNYAHSMFVFEVNGTRVTKGNYGDTFDTKAYKNIRKACKDILNKAMIKKEISFGH